MPHIRFKALKSDQVAKLSQSLPEPLAKAMATDPDNFTFEYLPYQFFEKGQAVSSYPFVEVLWFARAQSVQDESAQIITQAIKALGDYNDVVVTFTVISRSDYYENGVRF